MGGEAVIRGNVSGAGRAGARALLCPAGVGLTKESALARASSASRAAETL